jgi:hypothetical protein
MLIRWLVFVTSVVFTTSIAVRAQEPSKPSLTPHIITATKQVTLFMGLEKQMFQTIQKKEKTSLLAMLDDDFAIEMPGADPLEGLDWVDSVISKDFILKSFAIRQMSAVELGDAVVVNYDRIQDATHKGIADSGEFFVVDLWKKSGDTWKLANRFVSKVSSQPSIRKAPIRPTGKQ